MCCAGLMREELEHIEIYYLRLVGCFLFLYLTDMRFWHQVSELESFISRANSLMRTMYDNLKTNTAENGVEHQLNLTIPRAASFEKPQRGELELARRKQTFNLLNQVEDMDVKPKELDEISKYYSLPVVSMGLDKKAFLTNIFPLFIPGAPRRSYLLSYIQ